MKVTRKPVDQYIYTLELSQQEADDLREFLGRLSQSAVDKYVPNTVIDSGRAQRTYRLTSNIYYELQELKNG